MGQEFGKGVNEEPSLSLPNGTSFPPRRTENPERFGGFRKKMYLCSRDENAMLMNPKLLIDQIRTLLLLTLLATTLSTSGAKVKNPGAGRCI